MNQFKCVSFVGEWVRFDTPRGYLLRERRMDHGGCTNGGEDDGGKVVDPEADKERLGGERPYISVTLGTIVDASPVYERVHDCVASCSGYGKCVMHACECKDGRAGMFCQFSKSELETRAGAPALPEKRGELAIEILEMPAAVAQPMVSKFWGGQQNVYGATHEAIDNLLAPGNVEHLVAESKAPVKFVPFFPSDNFDNIGRPLGWFERLMRAMPASDIGPEAWYMFVSNQDRGMCAHPGMRNMLPDKSVVLSSFGLYSIDDLACFYPDRDIVLPAYKGDLGSAAPEFFREETKNEPGSALLFFAGTLKAVNPRCMGDSILRVDCNSVYSQGVRMYIVSKYDKVEGFNLKDSVDINAEMTRAKFCLVAGGYGFDMRLYDAVSRGCVPLLTQQETWQPLQHVLRYDTFALRIKKHDLSHLKEVLEAVPKERHAKMVANLQGVHKAFAWSPGMEGVKGRSMAFYHVMTAVAIVTGLELPVYVREMICTEHGEEFVLTILTRQAQEKVLPCTIDGKLVQLPKEENVAAVGEIEEEVQTRMKQLTKIREENQGKKPERRISPAKHFGFD